MKQLNKIIIAGLLGGTLNSFSAQASDLALTNINLSGTIEEVVSINFQPTTKLQELKLGNDFTYIPLALVYEKSNSSYGYIIKARSENGSMMKSAKVEDLVPYEIKYGQESEVSLSGSDQVLRDERTEVVNQATQNSLMLRMKSSSLTKIASGSYKDTITFTIEGR